ncbi:MULTISPECIES: NlpC/P60 family protein [unclassified Frankia]|uniref:C40 family peptidase n=1 Tax=unclassified Frankia TaxID=2632575 RepID=UPI001EF5DEF0|nr:MULTISPECIES: NlpC/P60 family protein [unclassified Frankia]
MAEQVLCPPVVGWFLGCTSGSSPSQAALDDIPTDYLTLYQQAATVCPGLDWSILAAIGKIESDHGRSRLPGVQHGENPAGAAGSMQFLGPTFAAVIARHPLPPGGTTPPSRYDPHDAIYAAAFELCDNGARDGRDLPGAIFAYNHADWYVTDVLNQAAQYSQPNMNSSAACSPIQSTIQYGADDLSSAALTAATFACGQIGKPYIWGGNGQPGFDCSGLTQAAYATAGIQIPRTAQSQYDAGLLVPAGAPLQAGDLVFFGSGIRDVSHVGLYLGPDETQSIMVDAPHEGAEVRIESFPTTVGARWGSLTYLGASRPDAG